MGACQPSSDLRARGPIHEPPSAELSAYRSWFSAPEVEPDLDAAQASTRAAREVLQSLPEAQRKRVLARWMPVSAAPTTVLAASSDGGLAPAPAPAATRPEVDLLAVMRGLHAQHGTRVLALSAFFLGPESVARATKRLRLAPERIGVGALSRVLKRREQPLLRHVREAERWATLYALAWPVERSWRVASRFGPRIHPVVGGLVHHRGVDVSVPIGTEVRAAADGRVTRVREGAVNGLWVEIDHGAGVRTFYLHLSHVEVKRGQRVKAGEVVARSGDTGRVTGAHLHYQVKLDRDVVDPLGSRASAALVAEPFPLTSEPPGAPATASLTTAMP